MSKVCFSRVALLFVSKAWSLIRPFFLALTLLFYFALPAQASEESKWQFTSKWANGEIITAHLSNNGDWKVVTSNGIFFDKSALEVETQELQKVTTKVVEIWERSETDCKDCIVYTEKTFNNLGHWRDQ